MLVFIWNTIMYKNKNKIDHFQLKHYAKKKQTTFPNKSASA